MCVIYNCRTTLPPMEELKRGAFQNDDGAGLAWVAPLEEKKSPLRVHWYKGLKTAEEVVDFIKANKIEFPLAIHFRTASIGDAVAGLCHPFPISKGVELWTAGHASEVLFHNGHISDWDTHVLTAGLAIKDPKLKFPEDIWSDSRGLAWLVALKGKGVLPFVLKGSRVSMLVAEPETLGTDKYDRANDHFLEYGTWVSKEGWSQSIETVYKNRGGRYYGAEWGAAEEGGYGDYCSTWQSRQAHIVPLAPAKKTSEAPLNTWSLEELTELVKKLEEEQVDANIVAGV